jgi:putative DNA primase/helicase
MASTIKQRERAALAIIKQGLPVIPLKPKSKTPAEKGWQHKHIKTASKLRAFFLAHPLANFGVPTGDGRVIIDTDGKKGKRALEKLERKHGPLPETVTAITPGGGQHLYFRYDGGDIGNSAGKLGTNIDVRGSGGFVVAAGSVHPNGGVYRYAEGKGLGEVKIATLPTWVATKLKKPKFTSVVATLVLTAKQTVRGRRYAERALEVEAQRVRKAPVHQRNDTLNRAAFRMGQFLPNMLLNEGKAKATLAMAAEACGLEPSKITATIQSGITAGQKQPRALPFLKAAGKASPKAKPSTQSRRGTLTQSLAGLGETDTHNAERFVMRYAGRLLWTPGVGFLVYDGHRWVVDTQNQRIKLATKAMKAIRKEAAYLAGAGERKSRKEFSDQSLNKGAIDRMLALVQPDVAVDDSKLDGDPYLLNVSNGTLDLRTGRLEKHDPADLITRICLVKYNRKAKCKLFKKLLGHATGGNKEMAKFLKKALGYTLTGSVTEQVLFFVYGPTGTSKSTFINLFRDMLGDYGIHTPTKTLLVRQYDNDIPVDVARMKGARMVTAIENNPNQQLDEAKIKGMTGGDKLTARFMRQNLFEFAPEFKLWIAINDLPRVRATDDAIWRRIIVLPFNSQVTTGLDKDLPAKLAKEAPGVLAWAVRGALLWAKEGLADKSIFETEKNRWREQSDTVGRFFGECCQVAAPTEYVQASVMFGRYTQWCTSNAEKPSSIKVFKARLIELNVTPKRQNKIRIWSGIKLIK